MKKALAPWIKVGAKVLISKWDPYRYNVASDVLKAAKEATITKIGTKYFYVGSAPFDKEKLTSAGSIHYNTRVFKDRDDIIGFFYQQSMNRKVTNGIGGISPEKIKLIHDIMFPHDTTLWGKEEIQDSIESIEWYGITSAMFPGSKFDKINAAAVSAAKEELKAAMVLFLGLVADGILAKHINNG